MALGFSWDTLKATWRAMVQGHQQAFIGNCGWLMVRVMVKIQFRDRHSEAPRTHHRLSKGT